MAFFLYKDESLALVLVEEEDRQKSNLCVFAFFPLPLSSPVLRVVSPHQIARCKAEGKKGDNNNTWCLSAQHH